MPGLSGSIHNVHSAAGGYGTTHTAQYGGGYGSVAGSRANLHQAPISPGAGSYYHHVGGYGGGMYQQTGPPSVYHGPSYGSRRGSMQSLVAASGTC